MSEPRYAYDVYAPDCPTRLVLGRLADKWALLILDRLQAGPMRFSVLKREIQRITQKVLTQTLRKLERDGLVSRTVFADNVPVAVEYALTPLGDTLTASIAPFTHWAEHHMDAVLAAQAAFDAASQAVHEHATGSTVHKLK